MSNELKVFVSYSRKHPELVHSLILELQATGIAADLTDEEKSPDEPRWKEVIDKADAVVFLVDSRLEPSPIERAEWQAALEASWKDPKKWLIPVLVGNSVETQRSFTLPRGGGRIPGAIQYAAGAGNGDGPAIHEEAEVQET